MADRRSPEAIAGEALEAAVLDGSLLYRRQGVALVDKIPTPIKRIDSGRDGSFRAVYQAQATADFLGIYLLPPHAGRAIALECKATAGDRLVYSRIEPQQRDWLASAPLAFVLVHFLTCRQVRLVPWSQFRPGSSVTPQDGWRVDAVRWLQPVVDGVV